MKLNFRNSLLFPALLAVLALVALLAVTAIPAYAQAGFFGVDDARVIQLSKPSNQLYVPTVFSTTHPAIDTLGADGFATIAISSATNGAQTLVAAIETSPDQTTWWGITNYALASYTPIIITNRMYGTNGLTATNVFFVNGSAVTPAAGSGFVSSYVSPALYTNTGATINIGTNALTFVSFNTQNASRYYRITYIPGGSATNNWTSSFMVIRKNGYP